MGVGLKALEAVRFRRLTAMLTPLVTSLSMAAEYHSPIDTAFSPDGSRLAASDYTHSSVALIDPVTGEVDGKVELGGTPAGLAWDAKDGHLFVAGFGAGWVAEIDAADKSVVRHHQVGRYPRGVAVAPQRRWLVAGDWGLGQLTVIDLTSGETRASIPVGTQPSSVAVTPDESLAVVSHLVPATAATEPGHASSVAIVDLEKGITLGFVKLPTGSTNVRELTVSADGKFAYVVHTIGRFHLPTTQLDRGWVNTNALSVIDLTAGKRSATVLLDQVMDGAADPWGVAVDPRGEKLYVTLSGVHQLAIVDLQGLSKLIASDTGGLADDLSALHREGVMRRVDLEAKGPRGIDVSADGSRVAVAAYFAGKVVLLDREGSAPVSVALGDQPEPDIVRRGEIAYHDAEHCFQRWLSCASCHPDARSDGLNWDLLNDGIGNPKNARSMLFSDRTPPVMSLGVRDRMETAVEAGFKHIQFTEPEAENVDSVSAYLASLEPLPSPHLKPDGGLTESAKRGKEIFNRRSVGCAHCHPEPLFTALALRDVGTGGPLDQGANRFDTPTLRELWRTPPYLHDGRAATLREVLVDHNPDDDHGAVSDLKPAEIDDLIEYLLTL